MILVITGIGFLAAETSEGHQVLLETAEGRTFLSFPVDGTPVVASGTVGSGSFALEQHEDLSDVEIEDLLAFVHEGSEYLLLGYIADGLAYTVLSEDDGRTFEEPVYVYYISSGRGLPESLTLDYSGRGYIDAVSHKYCAEPTWRSADYPDWDYAYYSMDFPSDHYGSQGTVDKDGSNRNIEKDGTISFATEMESLHGNVYTTYWDLNDDEWNYAVSADYGRSWRSASLPSDAVKTDLAVDPVDENTVFVALLRDDSVALYRSSDGVSRTPEFESILEQESVSDAHIACTADSVLHLIYRSSADNAYHVKSSADYGESWDAPRLLGYALAESGWEYDSAVEGNTLYFSYIDDTGNLVCTEMTGSSLNRAVVYPDLIPVADEILIPDEEGFVVLERAEDLSGVRMAESVLILFPAGMSGPHDIIQQNHDKLPLYMALYDIDGSMEEPLAENIEGNSLIPTVSASLEEGAVYLLLLGALEEDQLGETALVTIQPEAE